MVVKSVQEEGPFILVTECLTVCGVESLTSKQDHFLRRTSSLNGPISEVHSGVIENVDTVHSGATYTSPTEVLEICVTTEGCTASLLPVSTICSLRGDDPGLT